jgi:predicted dehydrogenase
MSYRSSDELSDNLHAMKILIVGLGAIGAGFQTPEEVENHASVSLENGFNLVGGVDSNLERRLEFISRFKKPAYADLKSAYELSPEVVVIATNPNSHVDLIESVLGLFPSSTLVCEKPFGKDYADSLKIIEMIEKSEAKLYVNYSRQFSKGLRELHLGIQGTLQSGTVTYNYGLSRSCSHFIRLCIFLFGRPQSVVVSEHNAKKQQNPSFSLNYDHGATIEFIGLQDSGIRIADFHFITNAEVIQISQGNSWNLLKLESGKMLKWPRELQELKQGNFFGGISGLYTELIAGKNDDFYMDLMDDAIPNFVIGEVISNER